MGTLIRPSQFKMPVRNTRDLFTKTSSVRAFQVQVCLYLPYEQYKKLYKKAKKECDSASPVHDVLMLLLYHYLENQFVVRRRLLCVDDPTIPDEHKSKRTTLYRNFCVPKRFRKRLFLRLTKRENTILANKIKKDKVSKSVLFDSLIEFYLTYKFIVRTKIIRTTFYRTGNEKTDIQLTDPIEQKKFLTALRDSGV